MSGMIKSAEENAKWQELMDKVVVKPEGFQIKVDITIPRRRIADVLCNALEGEAYGSGYWAQTDLYEFDNATVEQDPKHESWLMVDGEGYPPYAALPLLGGTVTVINIEDGDDEKFKPSPLNEESIKRGLSVLAIKHLNDILEENDDGDTADNFLQCCLFGEVIYG
jgi:hypothetical protein